MSERKKKGNVERSTSECALLGLLSLGAKSGYDLRQLIPRSIGHFWSESYGQIYPALKGMTAEKLIDKKTERGKGRPDRHVYSLTELGRHELRRWLKVPIGTRIVVRNELLLKVFFGAEVSTPVIREHVEDHLRKAEIEKAQYRTIANELRKSSANDPSLAYWLMTLNMGRHDANAKIAWCRETLKELERQESGRKR